MATQLSVVNKVLQRLREAQVSTVTQTEYSLLIAAFVNEAMTMIQEAHDWSALEHTVTFDLVPSQRTYDLSATVANGGGAANTNARLPNQKSYLLWNQFGSPQAWYLIDGDQLPQHQFTLVNESAMLNMIAVSDDNTPAIYPTYLSLRVNDAGTGWTATVHELPATAGTVTMQWWIPQEEFELDGTDNNTSVIIRPDLVQAYALRQALNERGEEMGEPGNMADERLLSYLHSAIETDMMNRSRTGRYEFSPD